MRLIGVTSLIVVMAIAAVAQTPPAKPAQADAVMKAAYARAKDGKKPVLVIFGATW